jgi:hypothetical protein
VVKKDLRPKRSGHFLACQQHTHRCSGQSRPPFLLQFSLAAPVPNSESLWLPSSRVLLLSTGVFESAIVVVVPLPRSGYKILLNLVSRPTARVGVGCTTSKSVCYSNWPNLVWSCPMVQNHPVLFHRGGTLSIPRIDHVRRASSRVLRNVDMPADT